jgi:alkaline phosphatase
MSTRVLQHLLIILFTMSVSSFCQNEATPKNIILYIGDGMGVSQVSAEKITKGKINLERFKSVGLLTTYSATDLVTESAAAATALATGFKTYNGALSVSTERKPLKTVMEYAEEDGKSTGVIATCTITHATPAAFFSHVPSRNQHAEIAEQIANSGVDVIIGGGWAYFVSDSVENSKRDDNKNLLHVLEQRMPVVRSLEEFRKVKDVDRLAAFLAPVHLPEALERNYGLAELTSKAIEILAKNNAGFVLMVEGSQIDWAGHDNNLTDLLAEMDDFDTAVGVGLDFAEKNGNTLVVVTADHETGGFAIKNGSVETRTITDPGFTTGSHTAAMVPVFASGPGEEGFRGIQDNTIVGKRLIELLTK